MNRDPESSSLSAKRFICGLDEAGRGPIAGPVCAAAVILPGDFDCSVLNDSKKLSEARRNTAMTEIYRHAFAWHIGWASSFEIDEINILNASLLAMKRAYEGMLQKLKNRTEPGFSCSEQEIEVIVDGLHKPSISAAECSAFPKADGTYPAVMAASILAKTARDRMMIRYSWLYPEYGYEKHKGYPTAAHIQAFRKNGPSGIQRETFRLKSEMQQDLFERFP
ncbi:ribonuclease HII [Brucepastera parasyntrophica]|uniref:ribonuclease HII n=1 Tax=Brucepastera parasyntrophica TaxID=2880008 RepID=UPI00210E8C35|nr:ribonuclease HII [Brucepastera parasyntrophica]ULQ59648.1 ribonuclease HII [Brucepastera parasyntrophica]